MGAESVRALVEFLARSLVDDPGQVQVTESAAVDSVAIEVRVAPHDLGKVIGKQGRIANALRSVARAAGAPSHLKVTVEIAD